MPAQKLNYLILYKGDSQPYGAGKKDIALATPPPPGFDLKDKFVWFIAFEPDTENLVAYRVPQEEVENAELTYPKKKQVYDNPDEE